ncbi:hypothetical protein HDV57DRAFT_83949 [Trichoderma longibrachiatum]|uniref:Uncharacterized protein n=1 Tax=Trichoderma longibrachiatum ATCC 18648 TaxID=983965 RepID=A0A2T4CEP0_TRILO|nr:hypothetical protein M440DRAFT_1109035 [Trichoderma longibrachiatum ATCC 18648]
MSTTFLSGAAFGAAMMAASFHNPAIVIAQMKFENWHMMQAFLAATASSAAMYAVADQLDYVKLKPRSSSPLGLFSKYDGNIIGGALLGTGMALSGSCPGTLYAQLAAGVHTGFHALNGAILGGLLWTGLLSKIVKRRKERADISSITVTANDQLGLSRGVTLLIFETVCISVLAATTIYTPKFPGAKLVGTAGGFLIGLSQLFSLATRKSMIGISTVYEEVGNYFWWLTKGADPSAKPTSYNSILFAGGVTAGAWGLLQAIPSLAGTPVFEAPPLLAMIGGALMAIGARMAGGCTSGHGISGISLLSLSSMITIGSTFAAGAVVAPLVY